MRQACWRLLSLSLVLSSGMYGLSGEKKTDKVSYEVFARGYFVKNNAVLKSNPAYLLLKDKQQFDQYFGIGFVMGPRPKLVDDKLFENKLIATVIKSGATLWKYEIEQVVADKQQLLVKYKATGKESPGATYNSPLIVAVPRGEFTEIVLIENDKEAAKLPLKK